LNDTLEEEIKASRYAVQDEAGQTLSPPCTRARESGSELPRPPKKAQLARMKQKVDPRGENPVTTGFPGTSGRQSRPTPAGFRGRFLPTAFRNAPQSTLSTSTAPNTERLPAPLKLPLSIVQEHGPTPLNMPRLGKVWIRARTRKCSAADAARSGDDGRGIRYREVQKSAAQRKGLGLIRHAGARDRHRRTLTNRFWRGPRTQYFHPKPLEVIIAHSKSY